MVTQEITDATACRCLAVSERTNASLSRKSASMRRVMRCAAVDEPGEQHGGQHQHQDPQTAGDDPFADLSGPEAPLLRPDRTPARLLVVIFAVTPTDSGLQESVDVSIEDGGGVAHLVVGPQILDHLIGAAAHRTASGCPRSCRRRPEGIHLGALLEALRSSSLACSTRMADTLFCNWDFSFWQVTTTPVGICVRRTAESVVTDCPPGPLER